jgi:tryptophan synthase alpha chain
MPLLFLLYYNTIFRYGAERFAAACGSSGVDGLIVPDLPFEERGDLLSTLTPRGIDLITMAAPNSGERLAMILPPATGFVYCVSAAGVTGERNRVEASLDGFLETVGRLTAAPRAVGFGISTPEQARRVKSYCEGVIVGSGLVRRLMEDGTGAALGFIASLRRALDEE